MTTVGINLATQWPDHYKGWDYRTRQAALLTMANHNSDVVILQGGAITADTPWPEPTKTQCWPEQGYSLFEARDLFDKLNAWILKHDAHIFEETTTARFDDGGECLEIYFLTKKGWKDALDHFGIENLFNSRHAVMVWLLANRVDELAYLWAGPY